MFKRSIQLFSLFFISLLLINSCESGNPTGISAGEEKLFVIRSNGTQDELGFINPDGTGYYSTFSARFITDGMKKWISSAQVSPDLSYYLVNAGITDFGCGKQIHIVSFNGLLNKVIAYGWRPFYSSSGDKVYTGCGAGVYDFEKHYSIIILPDRQCSWEDDCSFRYRAIADLQSAPNKLIINYYYDERDSTGRLNHSESSYMIYDTTSAVWTYMNDNDLKNRVGLKISPNENEMIINAEYDHNAGLSRLFLATLGGQVIREVTNPAKTVIYTNIYWSPDGKKIVVSGFSDNGNGDNVRNIYIHDLALDQWQQITFDTDPNKGYRVMQWIEGK